jgi:HB1, ASXL, restriction endonuclease HTH domain
VTVLDAVENVLASAGTPLSYREIADRMLKTGLRQTTGKTPHATVNAAAAAV